MFAEVFLIAKTGVDWTNYLSIAKQTLGRSVSQSIDAHKMAADSAAAFVCTLDEMVCPGGSPADTLRNPGVLADHVHFTFLVVADTDVFHHLMQHGDMRVNLTTSRIGGIGVGVVSGTLMEARTTVMNLTNSSGQAVRSVLNKLLVLLEGQGFKETFSAYKKQALDDRTFKLIEKK